MKKGDFYVRVTTKDGGSRYELKKGYIALINGYEWGIDKRKETMSNHYYWVATHIDSGLCAVRTRPTRKEIIEDLASADWSTILERDYIRNTCMDLKRYLMSIGEEYRQSDWMFEGVSEC